MPSATVCDPLGTCKWWCQEAKKKVPAPQPAIVADYNKCVGGVDSVDRYMSYYRIKVRTEKWTARFFTHFLDLAVCNAWIEYQRDAQVMGVPKKEALPLLQFKQDIAETLIRGNPTCNGKKSSDAPATDNSRPVQLPNTDTRTERFWPFSRILPSKKCDAVRKRELQRKNKSEMH